MISSQPITGGTNAITPLYYDEIQAPTGVITITTSLKGICRLDFKAYADNKDKMTLWANRWYGEHQYIHSPVHLQTAVQQLHQYFAEKREVFDLSFDLQGTEFQRRVWEGLLMIPYGKAVSYKWIAEQIGQPTAVRAVGGANNRNPIPLIIPCHRVIGMNGQMVGYGSGLPLKEWLLRLEGYHIEPVLF